jgi:capsular exopolysaccharide synthesis family protein
MDQAGNSTRMAYTIDGEDEMDSDTLVERAKVHAIPLPPRETRNASTAALDELAETAESLERGLQEHAKALAEAGATLRARDPRIGLEDAVVEQQQPAQRGSAKHSFDELKVNFLARYAKQSIKSIMFLGLSRGDGASTSAFNFAKSLAQDADVRVLFINADLRGTAATPGANDDIDGEGLSSLHSREDDTLLPALYGNVHVLPSGRDYADPAVLFQSRRFNDFLANMSKQYDYVIIDGPPLTEAPEAIALSSRVDGVVLVIDAGRTRSKIAQRAKKRIEDVGGTLLGVVLNRRRFYVPNWLYRLF